jgi:flagellar M-ring protein FliF
VPGALTNQPPTPGVALPPGVSSGAQTAQTAQGAQVAQNAQGAKTDVAPAVAPPDNTSKQATRNYEIDRTIAYTRQPAGRLKRLTVAVLVDNLRTTAEDGTVTETVLTSEQLANMTQLVKDAVGFDSARGDSVNVVNASFKGELKPEDVPADEIPLWERPLVRDIAKLLAGLIVLLVLVLSVLRPLVRSLLAGPRVNHAPVQLPGPDGAPAALPAAAQGAAPMDYDSQIAQARSMVTQDPARVAQVVKTWVGNDD